MSFDFKLPDGWKWVSVEEVQAKEKRATITGPFGSSIGKRFFVEVGVPVIRGNNLSVGSIKFKDDGFVFITKEKAEELAGYRAYPEDIIVTAAGTLGQVGIIPKERKYEYYIISNKQMRIRFDKSLVDPEFAYYWFSSKPMIAYMKVVDTGSTIPLINLGILRKLRMPLPPLKRQVEIRKKLCSLDQKIALNRQINQTLESMAQTIFKSWFVNFDPVKAKIAALESGEDAEGVTRAAMRVISGNTDDELDKMEGGQPEDYAKLKTTAELFPAAMQDSELGEVPEGWEISKIGDVVKVVGGGTPSTKNLEFWDGGEIHWTTPKDLSNLNDKVLLTTNRKITDAGLKKISSGLLPVNTVLMSSRAPVGYLALAKVPVAVNQGYIAMLCDKRLSPEFVIQWCNYAMNEIKQRSSGTTFAEISKKNFKVIPVIVPSEGIQQLYSKIASGFYDKITETAMECITLTDIRDSLLPKLLSGELRIEDK